MYVLYLGFAIIFPRFHLPKSLLMKKKSFQIVFANAERTHSELETK